MKKQRKQYAGLKWTAVCALPAGTRRIYVRYQIRGMAVDDFRLAAISG